MTSRLNRHHASGEKWQPKLGRVTPFELCVVEADYKLRDGSQRRDTVSCSMNIASMSQEGKDAHEKEE